MAKKSKKQIERKIALKEEIARKEYEDDKGIKRRQKYGYSDGLSLKTIRIIKIVLLVAGVLSYFLYSVLLLPIVFVYGLLYFSIRKKERNMNYGMRKELWIKLTKFDSIIALIIVVTAVSMTGLSMMTMGTGNSTFAGKGKEQIVYMLQVSGVSDAEERAESIMERGMHLTSGQRSMYQALTLLTGQRELFQTKYSGSTSFGGGMSGGSRPSGRPPANFTRPDGGSQSFSPPSGVRIVSRGGMSMGTIRLTATMSQMFSTVNLVLLIIVMAGGAYVVLRKQKDDQEQPKQIIVRKEIKEDTEMMRIKTIKFYTDKYTGEKYEVNSIRTVTRERGEVICENGYAREYSSKKK